MIKKLLTLLVLTLTTPLGFSEEIKTTTITSLKEAYLDKVLVSNRSEWAVGSQYLIHVKEPRNKIASVEDLLFDLDRILPTWYKQIIFFSQGDDECQAIINGADYTLLIETFTWEEVILKQHKLYTQIQSQGLDSKPLIDNAITYGLCNYIKTSDIESAKETFYDYARKSE